MGESAVRFLAQKVKLIASVLLFLCSLSSQAASVIHDIRYEGNNTTQAVMLNREIFIARGDVFDLNKIERSRQAIMNLELFKSVNYYLQDAGTAESGSEDRQIDVVFVIDEKHYFLILPRARISDSDKRLGVQVRWDNVLGLNHELRMLMENRGDVLGVSQERKLFSYLYNNVNNGPYNIGFSYVEMNEVDEAELEPVDRQDIIYDLTLSHWLNRHGRNRGDFFGINLRHQNRINVEVSSQLEEEINAIVLGFDLGYTNISNFRYNRSGKTYGYKVDWSSENIGSETAFTKQLLYYRSYYRFDSLPLANLNVQTLLGTANSRILGQTAFSLGSSSDLRGYDNNIYTGNSMFLTNMEYIFPHPDYPIIRYAGFIDVGSTYERLSDMFNKPLHVGIGVGLRWKLRSFVKVDLRMDIGYGISEDSYKFTFGTKHTF